MLQASGQSTGCLSQRLEARFERLFARPAVVTVELTARQPIIVSGDVRSPGSFDFMPGMTVMHALALAGGAGASLTRDPVRQAEVNGRLLQIARRRAARRLELARLEAASRGEAELSLDANRRDNIVADLGDERIALETAMLRGELDAHAATLRDLVEAAEKGEIAEQSAHRRKASADAHVEALRARSDEIEDLNRRGVAAASRVGEALRELIVAEQLRDEAEMKLIDAQRERRAADNAVERLRADHRLRLLEAQRAAVVELDELDAEANGLLGVRQTGADTESHLVLELVRSSPDGARRIAADPVSEMAPGDVLTVSRLGDG